MMVYVDEAKNRFGRMIMCHMMADDRQELMTMADRIGVDRKWLQNAESPYEHFDISKQKRAAAVAAGAIEVSSRDLVLLIRRRRGIPE